MTVDEMPAGREMDALVAEKVMGMRHVGVFGDGTWIMRCWGDTVAVGVPPYSTDVASAWEVVEKIARVHGGEAQFTVICRTGYSNTSGPRGEWIAGYRFPDVTYPGGWRWSGVFGVGEGATAPLAICRAALKAAGVDAAP